VHTTVFPVPVDGARNLTGAQVVERVSLGSVMLSQVVVERPQVARVAGDEGLESAAWAN
jgi:hypothetical protein